MGNIDRPKKVRFRTSNISDIVQIVREILVPSYFVTKKSKWKRSNIKSLYDDVISEYTFKIETIINQLPQYNYSHVLCDEKNASNIVGHILLTPPHSINNSLKPDRCIWIKEFYWKQSIHYSISAIWRDYKLHIAMELITIGLQKYCKRYWNVSWIAIKPIWQSHGYGTILLNESHKYIKDQMSNKLDHKVPIFATALTEKSMNFYSKNGYETFMCVNIEHGSDLMCWGMLYHFDKNIQKKWMSVLKNNIKYKVTLNLFHHLLPQNASEWIEMTVLLPIMFILVLICKAIRWIVP